MLKVNSSIFLYFKLNRFPNVISMHFQPGVEAPFLLVTDVEPVGARALHPQNTTAPYEKCFS